MYDIISYEVHNFLSYIYISKYTRTKIISVSYISSVHSVSVYNAYDNHIIYDIYIKKYFLMHIEKKTTQKRRGGVVTR